MHASGDRLARQRTKLWAKLQPSLLATPALKQYQGYPLSDYPVFDPSDVRADYGKWNSLSLSHDDLIKAAEASENNAGSGEDDYVLPGISCGFSTGTSGNRGIFVASAEERGDYIGQSLARLLPWGTLLRGARIALVLRTSNALYSEIGSKSRFAFMHIPLSASNEDMIAALSQWKPSILIAPAHRLFSLAQAEESGGMKRLPLMHCFTGGEPMGIHEQDWIAQRLGVRPHPIYQATEGFLGASCRYGRLHLNEHALSIAKDPVAGTTLWRPIISDLRRHSLPIINIRLDDLLEDSDDGPCLCGYAGRVIQPILGRVQDIWRWQQKIIIPSDVMKFMESWVPSHVGWQAIATPNQIELRLGENCPDSVKNDIVARASASLTPPVPVILANVPPDRPSPKRRQIVWQGQAYV